jgi:hypothetical protein
MWYMFCSWSLLDESTFKHETSTSIFDWYEISMTTSKTVAMNVMFTDDERQYLLIVIDMKIVRFITKNNVLMTAIRHATWFEQVRMNGNQDYSFHKYVCDICKRIEWLITCLDKRTHGHGRCRMMSDSKEKQHLVVFFVNDYKFSFILIISRSTNILIEQISVWLFSDRPRFITYGERPRLNASRWDHRWNKYNVID